MGNRIAELGDRIFLLGRRDSFWDRTAPFGGLHILGDKTAQPLVGQNIAQSRRRDGSVSLVGQNSSGYEAGKAQLGRRDSL